MRVNPLISADVVHVVQASEVERLPALLALLSDTVTTGAEVTASLQSVNDHLALPGRQTRAARCWTPCQDGSA